MSKLKINTSEYKWCECSINDRIQLLYDQYYNLCMYKVRSIKSLDTHTKEECILEAMWHIAKTHKYENINNSKNLLCQIAYNKCCDKLRHNTTKKRGGAVAIYSIEEQFDEEEYTDTNILDVETKLYLEQLKPLLTKTEYSFITTVLAEPHILSNREYAHMLNVNENTIRRIKNSIKNKIRN